MMKRSYRHDASVLLFFIFHCFCIGPPSHSYVEAVNSITQGEKLRKFATLVSPDTFFTLGFLNLGPSYSTYLAIWFKGESLYHSPYVGEWPVERRTEYVWIANRNNPIFDSTAALTIDADGKLIIMYDDGSNTNSHESIIISSEKASSNGSTVTATLLDSGNFVLNEIYYNGNGTAVNRVLWQSFDYPTNVLLPEMKLGMNLKTGKNWSLTSWISYRVPYSGAFTLEVDPNGTNQLVISRRGEVYWRSGVWTGTNFENLPAWTQGYHYPYNFSFISSKDEKYFTYSAMLGSSSKLVWLLNSMGQLKTTEVDSLGTYLGSHSLDCRINGKMTGCIGNKPSECSSGDEFVQIRYPQTLDVSASTNDTNMGPSDCESQCSSNCSCVAYASMTREGIGCYFWSNESKFMEDFSSPPSISIRKIWMQQNWPQEKKNWWIWLIIAVAIALVISLLAFLSYLMREKLKLKEPIALVMSLLASLIYLVRKKLNIRGETDTIEKTELLELETIERQGRKDHELISFKFNTIVAATDNFSSKNKFGEGGFGSVYKGRLLEGEEIAVKRLSRSSKQGLKEFKNEVGLIAKLQHRNLVRLLGSCIKGDEKMLIYEYMPNKSLDSFLFDPMGRKLLDWKKRINIIEGIAQGLLYLHTYSRLRVIHRDLKPSNILLDYEMNPKISDFGLARIFEPTESKANTNRIVGTYGYMSPEYAMEGIFSVKSDVFSFGVLLLEIVSGKKKSFNDFERHLSLIGYAWELWEKGTGVELMDPMLDTSCPKDKMLRCIHVGLLCVQESATDRPTMLDVVTMFTNEAMILPAPKQPAFSIGKSVLEADLLKDKQENRSLNGLTISVMEAR